MDRFLYNSLKGYYHVLEVRGYMPHSDAERLLVLIFIRDFVFRDYRGLLSRQDYSVIEKALNCLYGSSCLIPYPDYLKMGKLHLGTMTEMAQRVKTLEETEVLKAFDAEESEGDILIMREDEG